MRVPVLVLKFGSSVLASEEDLPLAVEEIARWRAQGCAVIAVVSAFAGETDRLLARAHLFSAVPDAWATAALVATGEAYSAALLGLALHAGGIPAAVLDAAAIRLETNGEKLDSDPVATDIGALRTYLEQRAVAVVPGFVGRHQDGTVALLGRGGSDLSAIFLAQRLGGRCRLIKDVDGLYEFDPASAAGTRAPRRFHTITYRDALQLDGGIVQKKAVRFAEEHEHAFEVSALGTESATLVGAPRTRFFISEIGGIEAAQTAAEAAGGVA